MKVSKKINKKHLKQYTIGQCRWCEKLISSIESYITFKDGQYACPKCYRNSRHMLPFWDKENKFNES